MVLQNGYVTGSLFGPEWKHVQEWPQAGPSRLHGEPGEAEAVQDAADEDEYEEEEEEIYVTLDLGPNADPLTLGTGTDYQLIGLDTPTPFLKIGNDVFRGTPQQLIGSEIITKDTRDPHNPIKHSHPAIGCTNHRIAFEPVKLVVHPPEPKVEKARPSMYARDVAPTNKPSARSDPIPSSPQYPIVPSSPPEPEPAFFTVPNKSRRGKATRATKAANTVRINPLSTRFDIPIHGEISADGIPRIDGQEVPRRLRKKGKSKADQDGAEVDTQSPVDADSSMYEMDDPSSAAGPSSAPFPPPARLTTPELESIHHNAMVQRVLLPDAPRGYTKSGLPRRKPGPSKGRKTALTIAREEGGVVSKLTGKLPLAGTGETSTTGAVGTEMDVDQGSAQGVETEQAAQRHGDDQAESLPENVSQ